GYRAIRATNVLGSVGPGVERVDMGAAAILHNEDTRFSRRSPEPSVGGRGVGLQQLGQSQAEQTQAADLQQFAAGGVGGGGGGGGRRRRVCPHKRPWATSGKDGVEGLKSKLTRSQAQMPGNPGELRDNKK